MEPIQPVIPANRIRATLDAMMSRKKPPPAPAVKIASDSETGLRDKRRRFSRDNFRSIVQLIRDTGLSKAEISAAAKLSPSSLKKWMDNGLVQTRKDVVDRFALAVGVEAESIFTPQLRYVEGRKPGSLLSHDEEKRRRSSVATLPALSPAAKAAANPQASISATRQQLHDVLDALLDSPSHASAVAQVLHSMRLTLPE